MSCSRTQKLAQSRLAPHLLSATQSRPRVKVIMPLLVSSLCGMPPRESTNKNNCTSVFVMLSLLCQDHPAQIALTNKMPIVPLLSATCCHDIDDVIAHPDVDDCWTDALNHFTHPARVGRKTRVLGNGLHISVACRTANYVSQRNHHCCRCISERKIYRISVSPSKRTLYISFDGSYMPCV